MNGDETAEEKNKRLYTEVRYAKNTSLRLKQSDPVFRLKRDYKNLTNEEYAANLINYLGSARKTSSLTVNECYFQDYWTDCHHSQLKHPIGAFIS